MEQHDRARVALNSVHSVVCVGQRPWSKRLVASFGTLAVAIGLMVPPAHAALPVYPSGLIPAAFQSITQGTLQGAATAPTAVAPLPPLPEELRAKRPQDAMKLSPFVELGALDSKPGEDKDHFMMRVARVLDAFTTATRHEACGAVMKNANDDAWRVRLITNRSQMACMRIMFEEHGFEPTADTIHSHPRPRRFEGRISVRITRADMSLGGGLCGKHAKLDDEDFSARDLDNGSGYLVARGKLLYNDGVSKVHRVVGVVDPLSAVDVLAVGGSGDLPYTQAGAHAARDAWSVEEKAGLPTLACPVFPKK